ncbi:MAG: sulfate permease [Burkholderiales bacterium]|nr:sulfate permease [Burkholderiales bacterium]
MLRIFDLLLPAWCKPYPREHLASDLLAGVMVAILVLPQSLAYALLAGLPPQAGLFASILPVIVYALVGSSMTQSVGPVAITAIMTFSVLSPIAEPGSPSYIAMAAALSLLSGVLVLALGALRLGFLSNLLSRPVVAGFITGSAVLILNSQLKLLLGLQVQGASAWDVLVKTLEHVPQSNPVTCVISTVGVLVLWGSRRWLARTLQRFAVPRARAELVERLIPLLVISVATLCVVVFDLDRLHGVAVVGDVKLGASFFTLDALRFSSLGVLAIPALTLAFIGTVQNITMAQALAIKRRERISANRELVGLGLSNIVAAFTGGMPVGGGLSRTAVNVASGGQTPLASVVTGLGILVILAVGTAGFARIPLAILAVTIVVAAISMVDAAMLRRAWVYDRADALAFLGAALGVLVFGLQLGILLGIGLSLGALLYRASTPHIAVVGRISASEHFRNVTRHGVETIPGVLFVRIDESMFFGNWAAVEARLMAEIAKVPGLHDLVLIMSAVNRIDLTALDALTDFQQDLNASAIQLYLTEVKGPVQDSLEGTIFLRRLQGLIFLSTNAAFEHLKREAALPAAKEATSPPMTLN